MTNFDFIEAFCHQREWKNEWICGDFSKMCVFIDAWLIPLWLFNFFKFFPASSDADNEDNEENFGEFSGLIWL